MKNSEDIDFVNVLHSQKNAKIDSKVLSMFIAILVFFLGAFIWSYFSEIDELTRGEGTVIPSEKIKTIQSLDGGLISEMLIKEGSIVKEGEPLMKIDTTRFEASLEENKQTYYHLLITKNRLELESTINLDVPIPEMLKHLQ
jgi:adhesin transport system membrane fusion protein